MKHKTSVISPLDLRCQGSVVEIVLFVHREKEIKTELRTLGSRSLLYYQTLIGFAAWGKVKGKAEATEAQAAGAGTKAGGDWQGGDGSTGERGLQLGERSAGRGLCPGEMKAERCCEDAQSHSMTSPLKPNLMSASALENLQHQTLDCVLPPFSGCVCSVLLSFEDHSVSELKVRTQMENSLKKNYKNSDNLQNSTGI